MTPPNYDQRTNMHTPRTSFVGPNHSQSFNTPTPNYAYDQRNYAQPSTSNMSPQFQTPNYAHNYGYGSNYNPRSYNQPLSNAGMNHAHNQRNYDYPTISNYSPQHQQNNMPNYGYGTRNYDYANPIKPTQIDSNYFQDQNNFAYSPNGYNPSNYGYPNEIHIESDRTFDQRNFGHSTESRHETHLQPHAGEIHSHY